MTVVPDCSVNVRQDPRSHCFAIKPLCLLQIPMTAENKKTLFNVVVHERLSIN